MSRAGYPKDGFSSGDRSHADVQALSRWDIRSERTPRGPAACPGSAAPHWVAAARRLAVQLPTTRFTVVGVLLCLAILAFSVAHGTPVPAGPTQSAAPDRSSAWRFTPLGPEGADVRRIFPLAGGRRLALTATGTLHLWTPPDGSFREGFWQAVDGGLEGSILLSSASGRDADRPLLLFDGGHVWEWWEPEDWRAWQQSGGSEHAGGGGYSGNAPGSERTDDRRNTGGHEDTGGRHGAVVPEHEPENDAGIRDGLNGQAPVMSAPSQLATGLQRGAFRLIGEVSPDVARQAVALLRLGPGPEARRLLLTRHGEVYAWDRPGSRNRAAAREDPGTSGGSGTVMATPGQSWPIEWLDSRSDSRRSGRLDGSFDSQATAHREPAEYEENERLHLIRSAVAGVEGEATVFALTQWEGVFVSRDGARSFVPVSGELPKEVSTLSSCGPMGLCAITSDGPMLCDDAGNSWFRLGSWASRDWAAHGEITRLEPLDHRAAYLALTRHGTLLLASNGGEVWTPLLDALPLRVHDMHRCPQGSEVLLATSRGVLVGDPGRGVWRWQNEGLREVRVQVARDLPFGRLIVGTSLGAYLLDKNEQSWCRSTSDCEWNAGEEALRRLGAPVSDVDLLTTPEGAVLISLATEAGAVTGCLDDDGRTLHWRSVGPRRPVTSVLSLSEDEHWLSGRHRAGVYLMRTSGDAWEDHTDLLRETGLDGSAPAVPRLFRTPGDGEAPLLLWRDGLWSLTAAGVTRRAEVTAHRPVRARAAESGLYLATGDGLFHDPGDGHWAPAGLAGERVLDVSVAPDAPATLVSHTASGIYWSTDNGSTWRAVQVPPELAIISGEVDREGRGVYLGSDQGLFFVQPPRSQVTLREPRPVFSSPNPFNQHVVLRCYLDDLRAADLQPQSTGIGETTTGGVFSEAANDLASGGASGHEGAVAAREGAAATREGAVAAREGAAATREGAAASVYGSDPAAGPDARLPGRARAEAPGVGVSPGELEQATSDGAAAEGEIRIFSVHGQLVRRLVGAHAQTAPDGAGYWEWSWDGRTEHGQEAPNGIYLLSTRIGPQSYIGKLVKFR